jgi:hypothetical protein
VVNLVVVVQVVQVMTPEQDREACLMLRPCPEEMVDRLEAVTYQDLHNQDQCPDPQPVSAIFILSFAFSPKQCNTFGIIQQMVMPREINNFLS